MTITTTFDIGQRVLIHDLENAKAVVKEICIGLTGISYLVHWFHNGKLESGYLYDYQLRRPATDDWGQAGEAIAENVIAERAAARE